MKKIALSTLSLALLGAAGAAQAQSSVTLYGGANVWANFTAGSYHCDYPHLATLCSNGVSCSLCCPASRPFGCEYFGTCHASAEEAYQACGYYCMTCR